MNIPFPNKKYAIIYSDPAWFYKDKALAGNRGAGCKYNVMSLEELKQLSVASIAEDDSIMFMWCTFPKLVDGTYMEVMRTWGFTPKTAAFVWTKHYKNGKSFMGMGSWTRANAEVYVLGIRGKPQRINAGIRQIIEEFDHMDFSEVIQSVPEKHSKKPNEVRERIVQLCGDVSRIELFARQRVAGWDSWGNEV